MINYSADIIPGKSIADICIEDNLSDVLSRVYLKTKQLSINKFSKEYTQYIVDNGIISFVINNHASRIINISCKKPYNGKYNHIFEPGLTVKEIIKYSTKQMLLHGFLIIDGIYGLGYNLTNYYEDCDYIDQLPKNLILEELYVMQNDWWR